MDLDGIIRELLGERKRLDRLIQTLEDQESRAASTKAASLPAPQRRRGRKSMDGPARRQVSERMKQYWARRREQRSSATERGQTPGAESTAA